MFETSELRTSNIYWGWIRLFTNKIYIFSALPERSTFIHSSQTWLQNFPKILFNISKPICRERRVIPGWIIKMLKSCGLLSLEVEKWFCCWENKRRTEPKLILRKKLLTNIWFSLFFSLTITFISACTDLKFKRFVVNFLQRMTKQEEGGTTMKEETSYRLGRS